MEFKELNLLPNLLENIEHAGFINLTKIQEQAIPFALQGKDITGLAQTGTGKTLAFLVPSIDLLLREAPNHGKAFILALAPTRELVIQIAEEARKLLKGTSYGIATIIGGTDYKGQEETLADNPGIIVATPGRLIDFVKTRNLDITNVQVVIIDEADRMFDMGFVNDLKYIFHKAKDRKQTMLFSATLSHEIIRLAYKYLKDPIEIQIDPDRIISERIDQKLYHLGRDEKLFYLVNLILSNPTEGLGIIFTNYKSNIPSIIRTLHRFGIPTAGLSSDFDQKKRIRLLKDFKLGKYKFMVATDVASRGIDVANIDVVYNYDLPSDSENYVHRIGRTARAGRKGKSISFCSESDYQELERIEKYLRTSIQVDPILEEYLKFPEGDFNAFIPEDPAILKSLNEKRNTNSNSKGSPVHGKRKSGSSIDSRKRAQNNQSSSIQHKKINKPFKEKEFNQKEVSNAIKSRPSIHPHSREKTPTLNERVSSKDRRNLFDIDKDHSRREKKKTSIWKKIKSLFGF